MLLDGVVAAVAPASCEVVSVEVLGCVEAVVVLLVGEVELLSVSLEDEDVAPALAVVP